MLDVIIAFFIGLAIGSWLTTRDHKILILCDKADDVNAEGDGK